MNHLTVSQLVAARVSLQSAIFDMNDIAESISEDHKIPYLMEDAFGSMDNAMGFLNDLVEAAQKESTLIKKNETLAALYKEYEMVRDLIGSEV